MFVSVDSPLWPTFSVVVRAVSGHKIRINLYLKQKQKTKKAVRIRLTDVFTRSRSCLCTLKCTPIGTKILINIDHSMCAQCWSNRSLNWNKKQRNKYCPKIGALNSCLQMFFWVNVPINEQFYYFSNVHCIQKTLEHLCILRSTVVRLVIVR